MKLFRNINAQELIKALEKLDYFPTRQKGSHIRLSNKMEPIHHITIPNHRPIKIGTLSSIIKDIAFINKMSKEELLILLFD
jgi:predicted RNA binding protein YcfA (HicA-like mRNA interferase family)